MEREEELFLSKVKIQQYLVQFAFRVPIRKELSLGEKRSLENVLKDLDSEVFQYFEKPPETNPACLFQVVRQVPVAATPITVPSFVFSNESFSFIFPIRLLGQPISGMGSMGPDALNRRVLEWLLQVQNIIKNPNCQRAGKIYELVLGPFNSEEKSGIFRSLFSTNIGEVGELNLTFARYRKEGDKLFNVLTNIRYLQQKLEERFFINVRVDINNRILLNSMEPRDIKGVWEFADSVIDEHLGSILLIPS